MKLCRDRDDFIIPCRENLIFHDILLFVVILQLFHCGGLACVRNWWAAFHTSGPRGPLSHNPSMEPGNVCSVLFETVLYGECCRCKLGRVGENLTWSGLFMFTF